MIVRACLLALLLMGVQGALNSQPSLFGKKVSSLGAGIIQFYPNAAIFETLKIAGVAALVLTLFGVWLSFASKKLKRRNGIGIAVVSYGLLVLASAVQYPALYESAIPSFLAGLVFRLSFVSSPVGLRLMAFGLMLLPLLLSRRGFSTTRSSAVACVGSVAVLWFVFMGEMPSGFQPSGANPRIPAGRVESVRKGPPHIIWIAVDSLRLDRLESPDRVGFLPAMQSFRDSPETVSFKRHHVGVPRTFPSWIEMIQGKYAAETGVRHMFPGFPARDREFDGIVSLAQSSGYRTVAVSDFAGDIFPRFTAGYDVIKAPGLALGTLIRQNIDQMFPLFTPIVTAPAFRKFFTSLKASPAYSAPRHLELLVEDALNESEDDKSGDAKPLFLTLFYSTAHFPYSAPWPYYRAFSKPSYPGPFWFQKNPSLSTDDQNLDDVQKNQVRALYDGALKSVDDSFAGIVAMLRARGLWDNAIVVLTADHGEDLFESGILQGHGDHLRGDQTLRVPLLIKMPAGDDMPAVRNVDHVTRSIDLAPTLASLAGLKGFPAARHALEGVDLSPLIRSLEFKAGSPDLRNLSAYSETEIWFSRTGSVFYQKMRIDYPGISQLLTFDPGHSGEIILNPKYEKMLVAAKHRSLVSGPWKLIYMPTQDGVRYELYDAISDPENAHDLSTSRPDVLAEMKSKFFSGVRQIESRARIIDDYVVPEGI